MSAIFISISKEFRKRYIILIEKNLAPNFLDALTELINMLSKKDISFNKKSKCTKNFYLKDYKS
jgi:hypothetical protein